MLWGEALQHRALEYLQTNANCDAAKPPQAIWVSDLNSRLSASDLNSVNIGRPLIKINYANIIL